MKEKKKEEIISDCAKMTLTKNFVVVLIKCQSNPISLYSSSLFLLLLPINDTICLTELMFLFNIVYKQPNLPQNM